jgi:hypothetical protein
MTAPTPATPTTPTPAALLAELHAHPDVAVLVFHRLRVAEAWQCVSPMEWRRYSLAFTGELDDGRERPIGRVFQVADGQWRVAGSDTHYPTDVAARIAVDAVLTTQGWALVAPQEMSW